jgi:hypothetical protein
MDIILRCCVYSKMARICDETARNDGNDSRPSEQTPSSLQSITAQDTP